MHLPDDLKDSILSIFEASLEAQLRAVRRLREGSPDPAAPRPRASLSQVDMAFDILKKARAPLHVSELLARIHSTFHRHRRSREPGLFPHQESRPRRSLPAHRQEHFRLTSGGPMTLFAAWSEIVADWAPSFPQPRTFRRAARQALGALVCVGRRCLSRIIWTQGRQQRSWSSEYFLHSRCRWEPQTLFAGVWRRALPYCPGRLVGVAVDDTRLRKTGRAIPQARYHRDPLSPPFHVNLMRGLRFLQASLLLPLHRRGNASCRALPVRFEEAAPLKKPSRKAGAEAWQEYKRMSKLHNLSQRFVAERGPLAPGAG